MQSSSKKSSTQSPFPADSPPPDASENAEQPEQALTRAKEKALKLPVGPGLTLMLEDRFLRAALLALFIYGAAAVVSNEWLYLLASGFVTILFLGFWIPLIEVLDLQADASMPEGLMVEQDAQLQIRLRKRFILRFLSWLIPLRCLRIQLDMVRRRLPGQPEETVINPEPMLVDSITDEVWLGIPLPKLRRGIYQLKGIELMSCYPFGLAWWKRTITPKEDIHEGPLTIAVHPKSLEVKGDFLNRLRGTSSSLGFSTSDSISVIQSTSVRGVREFRMGDSIRHIHWPSTARLGKLLVREFDSESLPVYDLLLDLRADWKSRDQFELAVTIYYSLVNHSYQQGRMPDILLNPPLESPLMQKALMFDLPKLPPGMQRVAEILARVEPMNMIDVNTEKLKEEDWQSVPSGVERDVVAPIPMPEVVPNNWQPGQTSNYPIELIVVPDSWHSTDDPKTRILRTGTGAKVLGVMNREGDLAKL
jgi:Protein of unknown function DUF58